MPLIDQMQTKALNKGTLSNTGHAGYDVIVVETVGVGQSETTVASMVDFFLVLMLAGAGDELQGIKKGVLELADAIAINKADANNIENAEKAKIEYEKALNLLTPASKTWSPPVLTCSAVTLAGIKEIWQTIVDHNKKFERSGELSMKRRKQSLDWLWALVEEGLLDRFYRNPDVEKSLTAIVKAVEEGETAPTAAAHRLLDLHDA